MENQKGNVHSIICKNCGGKFDINDCEETVECEYCGSKYSVADLLGQSDEVRIEKSKSQTHKEIEQGKQQIELEKLRYVVEKETKQNEKTNYNEFKKSKFSKILIIFAVITLITCFTSFQDKKIIAGIISLIQTILFLISWLMGMQVIKEKRSNIRILLALIAFLLIIPFIQFQNVGSHSSSVEKETVTIEWAKIKLGKYLPKPSATVGEINDNTEEELWIELYDVAKDEYVGYIEVCKDKGYKVEGDENSVSYSAYNEEGYKLDLTYYSNDETMTIMLESPMEMKALEWPDAGIGSILPVPDSEKGNISIDESERFSVYVGGTSLETFDSYVKKCKEIGFTVDYNKSEEHFSAKNNDGYVLTVSYEGNNVMLVSIEGSGNFTQKEKTTQKQGAATKKQKKNSASKGVSPDFKKAMDAYEEYFDSYIEFMKKYKNSDYDPGMLEDYGKMMETYSEKMSELDNIKEDELSAADLAYYYEVIGRINEKILEIDK